MRRKRSYLMWSAAGAVLGMSAVGAMAQTVTLSITADATSASSGTWSVYAGIDSGTDNAGLATFAIDVIGSDGVKVTASYDAAPRGTFQNGGMTSQAGFIDFPSNGLGGGSYLTTAGAPGIPGNGIAITAAQNIAYGDAYQADLDEEVIQGFGKTSGSKDGLTWSYPAEIAQGTYSGSSGMLSVSPDWSIGQGIQSLEPVSDGKWVGPGNIVTDVVISSGGTGNPPPPPPPVIGTSPIGASLGPELVETGGEPYNFLTLTESSPVVTGNFQYTGFKQGDIVDILLKFGSTLGGGDPAPADLANIIAYINSDVGAEGTIASAIPAILDALYPGYDLLLSYPAGANDPYLGFDFSGFGDTSIPTGSLGILGVGLVPEPSSVCLLALGAIGLMRRRRNELPGFRRLG